jgi:hypothetical protein|tara:strand:+ start:3106 stop:3348 length:243 start_codon:yes stop_codon:yes gene_type:complete
MKCAIGCSVKLVPGVRWRVTLFTGTTTCLGDPPKVLQQARQCVNCGELYWEDVKDFVEENKHGKDASEVKGGFSSNKVDP